LREFATLQVRGGHVLRAWLHHSDALQFDASVLCLLSEGSVVVI
jgi:hypothetical protein